MPSSPLFTKNHAGSVTSQSSNATQRRLPFSTNTSFNMLRYAGQPPSPFNSPYQHASSSNALLESSNLVQARHDNRLEFPNALGLYNYPQPATHALSPSPQPSEAWGTPMMPHTVADPWASGAFEHPASQSPLPWVSAHTSPRSSMSPYTREVSVFSHEGSEHAIPNLKDEYSPWRSDVSFSDVGPSIMQGTYSPRASLLTVAPERLNAGLFSSGGTYAGVPMPKYESTPSYDYSARGYERASSEESAATLNSKGRVSIGSTSVPRLRARNRGRTNPKTKPDTGKWHCDKCPEARFARKYNYTQHLRTHDKSRKKENVCKKCGKAFVRKADLVRHDASVHKKDKSHRCSRCSQAFPRKDTCRRHETSGCRARCEVHVADASVLSQLRTDGFVARA